MRHYNLYQKVEYEYLDFVLCNEHFSCLWGKKQNNRFFYSFVWILSDRNFDNHWNGRLCEMQILSCPLPFKMSVLWELTYDCVRKISFIFLVAQKQFLKLNRTYINYQTTFTRLVIFWEPSQCGKQEYILGCNQLRRGLQILTAS